MSVQVKITEINRETKTLIVEAFKGSHRIFKSPMRYKLETKKHIESVLKKELKTFNSPLWGRGFYITYLCQIEVSS